MEVFFLFDHLEGEAHEEIKYRSTADRSDPAKIIVILRELYGHVESYVALQEAFFLRWQQNGETLQEISLTLMSLMSGAIELWSQSSRGAATGSPVMWGDRREAKLISACPHMNVFMT